jgi:cation-transporting ATPase E
VNSTIPISGLSTEEATKRFLKQSAPKHSHTKSTLSIIWSNVFSPFTFINIVVIITLVSLYFYWSDTKLLLDCVGIVLVVTANTVIAIIQEIRARTIIEKARLLQQHLFTVIRDGNHQQIEHTDIVLGDIVFVKRGDAIPIDGEIRISNGLEVDESLITGESDVIIKPVNSMVTSGSICVAGEGYIECTTIQTESYAQKISSLAQTYSVTRSPLQRKINQIFEWSFFVALVLIGIEIFANFISNKPFTIDFVRRSATVVLTLIPEGIVFFSTVTFAIAVVKAQKLGVIIQKLSSIESLAGIDVLCFDKTGTLTDAMIQFSEAISLQKTTTLSPEIIHLYAQHSTEKSALISALSRNEIDSTYTKVNEIPFSSERKFSAIELVESDGNRLTLYLGAIEALESYITIEDIPLLEGITSVPKRTLLLCSSTESLHLNQPKNLIPQIVIYFEEQIKYDVVPTLELCKKMEIQTIIISGDSPTYIASILHRLDHSFEGTIVEGTSLISSQPIPLSTVYARMTPHQKADVIHQYQQNGRVAMVGDGVNDVPALKAADLSIAMNAGSTITREISDIVLQKNSFESLPKLFSMGRNIIASCLVITQLYLVKNIIVVLFNMTSIISTIPFPFTPRRSGLLGLLTTAVPAYFFSLYNSSETTTKEFFQRIWSVLIPSVIIITSGAIAVGNYTQHQLGATKDETSTIIMSVLLVTLVLLVQFLATIQNRISKKSLFLMVALLGIYTTLLLAPHGIWGLEIIQSFYEISMLPLHFISIILIASFSIAIFLFGCMYVIYKLFKLPIALQKNAIY